MIDKAFAQLSKLLYVLATFVLTVLALVLVGAAAWQVVESAVTREAFVLPILDAIGLVVIGIAVIDVAKFLLEEEVLRDRELRSAGEARQSLTKFVTIIVIVVCLEGLVMIFETKEQGPEYLIYPAAVVATGIFALIGLGLFQWFSRHAEEAQRSVDTTVEEQQIDEGGPALKTGPGRAAGRKAETPGR